MNTYNYSFSLCSKYVSCVYTRIYAELDSNSSEYSITEDTEQYLVNIPILGLTIQKTPLNTKGDSTERLGANYTACPDGSSRMYEEKCSQSGDIL